MFFTALLFLDYSCYFTVGIYNVNSCGQILYIDTVSVGSLGYFLTVCVVYAYAVCRLVCRYVHYVADRVRLYGQYGGSIFHFLYTCASTLVRTCKTRNI